MHRALFGDLCRSDVATGDELVQEVRDSRPVGEERLRELFEKDSLLGYRVMLNAVKLFKARMDQHTRQFMASLSNHPMLRQSAS